MVRRCAGRVVLVVLGSLVAAPLPMLALASPAGAAAPDPAVCPIADSETETECRVSTAHSVPAGAYAFHKTLHVLDGGRIQGPPGTAALALVIDGASGGAGDLIVDTGGSIVTDHVVHGDDDDDDEDFDGGDDDGDDSDEDADDEAVTSAAPLDITTAGSVFMQAGSRISARTISTGDDDEADGGGGAIRLDANGAKVVLCGSAADEELDAACSTSASTGATITADKNGEGVGDAGAITIDVGSPQGSPPVGVLAMGAGSVVRANGRNAAGDIAISTGHSADIAGEVLSQVPSGATSVEAGREGASIAIKTACGLAIAPTGVVSSLGRGHGADLVHLESCEVAINGRVESTGGGHVAPSAPANRCAGTFRPDKPASATGCVEVWAKRITIAASGEVDADVSSSNTGAPTGQSWVDLFAQDEITIEGATGPGGAFAVHADSYKASDGSTNTVTAKVLNGTFSASGQALSAKNAANGAGGGSVIVEAAGDIDAAGARLAASGDLDASPVDDGGDIAVRAATGALTWTDGTGDVRPNTTGTISLTSCVAPVTTGTNFNGATPALVTDCTLAPSLPAYAQGADGFLDQHCDDEGGGGGEIDAPPLDPSVPTTTYAATQFLYSGESPVQVGVEPGTIEPLRAAVVRGRALRAVDAVAGTNEPLEGVAVSFLGHPELGSTRTRADGSYDLAANGGGRMTLVFEADGYFSLQRSVDVAWQEMEVLDDVVLTGRDALATSVTFSPESPLQAHTSSTTNDERGLRRSTLLIPPGTTATMALPDGTTQALAVGTVRATEYTVGPSGPQAMPAELPPTSGYTYAAELSVDEAQAAGATTVIFSQPVFNYVENFIGFPVGSHVPSGSYDAAKAQWIPSPDGRVVAIVGVDAGLAAIDTTGDGVADDAAALGFTDAERAELATRYPVGQTLWRVPLGHFSSVDHNWPRPAPPAGASGPGMDEPRDTKASDRNCLEDGSVIACESQVLGEDVAVVGAPFGLHYRSSRSPGRLPGLHIPLTGASPPAPLKRVELIVSVAGTTTRKSFAPGANLVDDFTWDGRDAYGRLMTGAQPYAVRLDYVYDGVYYAPRTDLAASFATTSGVPMATTSPGPEVRLGQSFTGVLGGLDARGVGLGGWTPSVHHTYDLAARTIYLGSGAQRSAAGLGAGVVNTVPGAFGEEARGLAVAPDGTIYFTIEQSVRRLATDGTMTRYAGGGSLYDHGFSGDGGPAVAARFFRPQGLALAPDGSLYVADSGNYRVRRIGPDGIVTTVAGNGVRGTAGHGVPAVEASFRDPQGLALAPDGSLYIADAGNAVRRVGPDGIVTTVAARVGYYAEHPPSGAIAIGPDGSVFVAYWDHRVWRLDPSGTLTPFAGNGTRHSGPVQDGLLATEVSIADVDGLGVAPDGSVYFGDSGEVVSGGPAWRVRRVLGDGRITTVAGGGLCGGFVESMPAHGACIARPTGIAFDPAGNMLIGRVAGYRLSFRPLLRVTPASPGLAVEDTIIPSADGAEAYVFGGLGGRHLHTVDAFTGVVRYRFAYDPAGRLASVTDVDGNVTTFEHDALGNPTAIVAPFGQRTTLTTDANGYLASIANPAGESIGLTSSPSGLLESFTDPRGNVSRFTYDSNGLLLKDEDAVGGSTTLARSLTPTGHVVTATTAEGRVTRYETERLVTGVVRSSVTDPVGSVASLLARTDGTFRATLRDGAVLEGANGPDPRFGMQAPIETQLTTTLPSGMRKTVSRSVTTTLANPTDPFSLTTFTSRTTRNAKTTTDTYDAATRRMTTTTPAGRARSVTFDATGKPVRVETPGVAAVTHTYDARGRLTSSTQGEGPDARTSTFTYGLDGLLASITDAEGRSTSYARDAAGRVLSTTLPGGRVVAAAYDPSGNVSAITPPGRTAHTFTHTPVDQVATMTPPLVGTSPDVTTYAYNRDRDPTSVTAPGSEVTTYTYNAAGQLVGRSDPTATTTLGYDSAGRLATVAGASQSLGFTYDGSLLATTIATGTSPASVTRAYDTDMRLASRALDGSATTFAYDPDGMLTGAGPLALAYSATTGQLTGTTLGATAAAWSYDAFGAPASEATALAGTEIMRTDYERDRLGRITSRTETSAGTSHTFAYSYDTAGRLAEVQNDGAIVESYTYDQNGNRLTGPGATTATYDAQDRMTAYGDTTYTYSPAGRLTAATTGAQTTTYTYDPSDNLTAVTLPDATSVSYKVDPTGRRISRSVNGVMTDGLIYAEGLAPIAATDATGAITSTFTYGSRGNVPDAMVKQGVTYRMVTDHLGSVRLVINATTGAVAQRMDYDTFGNVLTDTNPGFQPFGFAGGLYDPATKLTRFGARDYDAKTGRWTTKDPIGFAGGDANLYAYVGNDPVNRIDPSGLVVHESVGNLVSDASDAIGAAGDWLADRGGDLYDSWHDGFLCEVRQVAKVGGCILGHFSPFSLPSRGGILVESGALIGHAGVVALTYTAGGLVAAGGAAALAVAAPILVLGVAFMAAGAIMIWKECT